ncbi:MAG: glucokinase [Opitutaceae bacterium]|nr:glucokinase [Opitutaceae bacterium]
MTKVTDPVMQILSGDIGGTNARLIFAEFDASHSNIVAEKNYSSADFNGLIQLIDRFFSEHGIAAPIDAACFAIAGPVECGAATVTNLPWVISEQQLSQRLRTPRVKLINDLVAAAYGISELQDTDILMLQQGVAHDGALLNHDAVIIAAGTGFGVAHLVWLNDHYQAYSSEAGHVGFAPENIQQNKLLAWLQKKHSHVSLEMLLSGRGLVTIYHFLHEVIGLAESSTINKAMQENDSAQVITENALIDNDFLCQKTLEMFIDIYGAAAGNTALQYYPIGILYIAGGIAPKIKDKIMGRRFTDAFINKGLMSSNMKKITIKLIMQDKVNLHGALQVTQQTASINLTS